MGRNPFPRLPSTFPANYSDEADGQRPVGDFSTAGTLPRGIRLTIPNVLLMLLALCHRCWTWMEPKHERCVECGGAFSLLEPDPDVAELHDLLGEPLIVLGEVSMKRPRLPAFGVLSAHDQGLLFLPDLRELPTGGLVAVAPSARANPSRRPGFWSLFSSRESTTSADAAPVIRPKLTVAGAVERFLGSPGALFIRREAIVRIQQRGTLLRVERKPGRTVAWHVESSLNSVQDQFRRLKTQPGWSNVPMS